MDEKLKWQIATVIKNALNDIGFIGRKGEIEKVLSTNDELNSNNLVETIKKVVQDDSNSIKIYTNEFKSFDPFIKDSISPNKTIIIFGDTTPVKQAFGGNYSDVNVVNLKEINPEEKILIISNGFEDKKISFEKFKTMERPIFDEYPLIIIITIEKV